MEANKARLVVLIDPTNKTAFEAACASRDLSSSEVIRQLILDYLTRHGVILPKADGDCVKAEAGAGTRTQKAQK